MSEYQANGTKICMLEHVFDSNVVGFKLYCCHNAKKHLNHQKALKVSMETWSDVMYSCFKAAWNLLADRNINTFKWCIDLAKALAKCCTCKENNFQISSAGHRLIDFQYLVKGDYLPDVFANVDPLHSHI